MLADLPRVFTWSSVQ